jgi:hypothetical protein
VTGAIEGRTDTDRFGRASDDRWLLVAVAGVVLGGLLVAVLRPATKGAPWGAWTVVVSVIGLAVMLAGAAFVVSYTVRHRSRQGFTGRFTSSSGGAIPVEERRAVLRAVRRGQPLVPAQRDVALRLARSYPAQQWQIWFQLLLVIVLDLYGGARSGALHWGFIALATAIGVFVGWLARQLVRMNAAVRVLD